MKGWRAFFHDLMKVRTRAPLAKILAEAAACSLRCHRSATRPGGMNPGTRPGPRRRKRDGCTSARKMLESCCATALEHLRSGGVARSPSCGFDTSVSGRRLATACGAASRACPLSFEADARGRLRTLHDSITCCAEERDSGGHVFLGGRYGHYRQMPGSSDAGPNVPFKASRLSTPDVAAVVSLDTWLSDATRVHWNAPCEEADAPDIKGYFQVPMLEWKAAVRRMVRTGLLVAPPPNAGVPQLRAGAFAVRKDHDRDRLIADRRPRNAKESMSGPVRLPYAPKLRRLIVKPGCNIRIGKRDSSNAF